MYRKFGSGATICRIENSIAGVDFLKKIKSNLFLFLVIFLSLLFSDAYCMMTGFMQLLRVGVFKR